MRLNTCDLWFELTWCGEGRLSAFAGTTLRGAFGFALKSAVCHVAHRQCDRCILRMRCAFPVIFEGIPPADRTIMRKYPHVPQPFVLIVDDSPPVERTSAADDTGRRVSFGIRLFGPAVDMYPYAAFGVIRMAQRGLGGQRVPARVLQISDGRRVIYREGEDAIQPPHTRTLTIGETVWPASRLRLTTVTPLRLRVDGRQTAQPTFADIGRAIVRRIRILSAFYGQQPLDADISRFFEELASCRTVEVALQPRSIPRFSTRQQVSMDIGGLMGYLTVSLPPGSIRNWFQVAESLHIGKATSFGLGRIRCEELA